MPHGFDTFRVFISAPGDLESDHEACHGAISEINERVAMPAKVLLVTLGLRDNEQISGHRGIVSDNVRWSSYFIQIFEDDWGPRDLFRKLFLLALECKANPEMPMRELAVFLKDAPNEKNPDILAFRSELEQCQDVRVFRYSNVDELKEAVSAVTSGWAKELVDAGTHQDSTPQI